LGADVVGAVRSHGCGPGQATIWFVCCVPVVGPDPDTSLRHEVRGLGQEANEMGKNKRKAHQQHLCALMAAGEGLRDIKPLVLEPRFGCASCGRVAHKKKNLCKPKKL
jgi:hypothetical protein